MAFQVPERYAERLARDQQVRFTVAAVAREFVGTVDFVDPVVQVPGRTILIKARVPNPDRALRPGMFVEARLATEVRPEAIVIPEDAILPLGNQSFAWVVADGTATRREVTLGVRTPGFVEITQGVDEGEQVVVGGLQRLRLWRSRSGVEREPGSNPLCYSCPHCHSCPERSGARDD